MPGNSRGTGGKHTLQPQRPWCCLLRNVPKLLLTCQMRRSACLVRTRHILVTSDRDI